MFAVGEVKINNDFGSAKTLFKSFFSCNISVYSLSVGNLTSLNTVPDYLPQQLR